MTQPKSLRAEILERLHLNKGGSAAASHNIKAATKDFAKSNAPQFRGKSQKKRHQMAVAAGLSAARGESAQNRAPALTESKITKGSNVIYRNKPVVIRELNESAGLALIKVPRQREPIFVRIADLQQPGQLTEGFLGMTEIPYTYVEPRETLVRLENLSAADIGLDLYEEDPVDEDYGDDQEEDADNGSNMRHDGHTGRTEVDALPTPSDTIAPAYDDTIAPKQQGRPLSTERGAEPGKLWQEPDWDGYDYPADAPEIPTAEFPGAEMGNARAPDQNDHHDGGDGLEDRDSDNSKTDESARGRHGFSFVSEDGTDFNDAKLDAIGGMGAGQQLGRDNPGLQHAMGIDNAMVRATGRPDASNPYSGPDGPGVIGRTMRGPGFNPGTTSASPNPAMTTQPGAPMMTDQGSGSPAPAMAPGPGTFMNPMKAESLVLANYKKLLAEMDDMLGKGEDREPHKGDTITLTLPAMASVVCTIAHRVGGDPMLMKAVIEALAEVGHGKTIDVADLEAVASHVNGEETQEVENREAGRPDHEGIGDEGDEANGMHHFDGGGSSDDDHESDEDHGGDASSNFEPSSGDGERAGNGKTKLMGGMGESFDYYGLEDIIRESAISEEDEIRLVKKRAGMRYW